MHFHYTLPGGFLSLGGITATALGWNTYVDAADHARPNLGVASSRDGLATLLSW